MEAELKNKSKAGDWDETSNEQDGGDCQPDMEKTPNDPDIVAEEEQEKEHSFDKKACVPPMNEAETENDIAELKPTKSPKKPTIKTRHANPCYKCTHWDEDEALVVNEGLCGIDHRFIHGSKTCAHFSMAKTTKTSKRAK